VAIKKFSNSQEPNKYFLNEVINIKNINHFNDLADTLAEEGGALVLIAINPKCLLIGLMTPT
jgi:hypothetical protein